MNVINRRPATGHLRARAAVPSGFTLIELLVVISIIALLIGILLPALGAARESARKMQSSTQVRGIHQALSIFSQGNNTWYAGIQSDGSSLTPTGFGDVNPQPNPGSRPETRYRMLLSGDFLTSDALVSPSEEDLTPADNNAEITNQFSYCMPFIGWSTPGSFFLRWQEWSDTSNSEAVVVSDRNTGADATTQISSIWTDQDSGDWRGSVAWNDGHVTFESEAVMNTRVANATNVEDDNLFIANEHPDEPATDEADARMIWGNNSTDLVSQVP